MDVRQPISSNGGDWITKFGEIWKNQVADLQKRWGKAIEEIRMPIEYPTDVPIVFVEKISIVSVLQFLKTDEAFQYDFLSDITATDEQGVKTNSRLGSGENPARFQVVYNLFSMSKKCRIRLKVRVHEGDEIPSVCSVWKGADWAEREVFDMFGIRFKGHPNLRRILMDSRWEGFPLRKDYPLKGYQVFTEPESIDASRLE